MAVVLAACSGDSSATGKQNAKTAGNGSVAKDAAISGNPVQPVRTDGAVSGPGTKARDGSTASALDAASADGSTGTPGNGGALINPAPGSRFFVGANFWHIDWEGTDQFWPAGTDFATVTHPWRPELLADLEPYKVLRFMDWNITNNANNPQAKWATRVQPTASQTPAVAFEWQIDLCNVAKKDMWITIPHESDSDPGYVEKLATLIRDKLDPRLRVYVEWSNEVWNGSFVAKSYADQKGNELGLAGDNKSAAYYVYAAVRTFAAFEKVFGKGSPRLVKVLAGQAAWTGPCEAHLAALEDSNINPDHVMPDVYAVAPYVTGATISELDTKVSEAAGWVTSSVACAKKANLKLISYEGGTDMFSAPNNGCVTLQSDATPRPLYVKYLDAISAAGLTGPFMQYTHTGGCWGLKAKTGDALAISPKYAGVIDWLAAHP